MKIILVSLLCLSMIAIILAQSTKKELMDLARTSAKECIADGIGTEEDFGNIVKKLKATNHEMMCLRNCISKKLGMRDDNGILSKSVVMSLIGIHVEGDADKIKSAEEIVDGCMEKDIPDDQCEATEQFEMCFMEEARKRGGPLFYEPMEVA